MKIVTTEQIKNLDRETIRKYNVSGSLLMERAGREVANGVIQLFKEYDLADKKVLLVAGRGNNGGDAFVAARLLKEDGFAVQVLLAGEKSKLRGAALIHFKKIDRVKIAFREIKTEKQWDELTAAVKLDRSNSIDTNFNLAGAPPASPTHRGGFVGDRLKMGARARGPCIYSGGVIVDGILGTGLEGKARGVAASAIRFMNALSGKRPVLAIDIPSGLNSDTGLAEGAVVRADLTVTMGLPKRGLIEPRALKYVGKIKVVDLGFPPDLIAKIQSENELITGVDLYPLFPPRNRDSHKGNYGRLLIMGGSSGYSGAITLAALAAVRSGVGLVTVLAPERLVPVVAINVPEAMVHGAPETDQGSLDSVCWKEWQKRLGEFSAILAGPGMTRHSATRRLVEMILKDSKIPVVLDADALNVFEGKASKLSERRGKLVITPHPGEMARLLNISVAQVQANRVAVAMKAASLTHSTTVLKGAGTLVAEEKHPVQINMTGNPGMAAGGMGDVLAGLLGGLLAQGMTTFNSARAAVYLHGRAGDLAAAKSTEQTLIARDLITFLPQAYHELSGR